MRISVGAIIILLAVGVWGREWLGYSGSRYPASVTATEHAVEVESIDDEESLPRTIKRESYTFKRSIDAQLEQVKKQVSNRRPFAKVEYEGIFSIDWISRPNTPRKRALISFEVKTSGKTVKSTIPFVVEFQKDWIIEHIETMAATQGHDEDSISILKDFVSIYAFKTQQDTAGPYEAKFSEKGTETHYEKVRYLEKKKTALSRISIQESKHVVVLDPQTHLLISMQGTERTSMGTSADLKIITWSTYQLSNAKAAFVKRPHLDQINLVQSSLQLEPTVWLEAQKWDQIKASLDQIQRLTKPQRLALFHELVKTLKKDPKNLDSFKAWLAAVKGKEGMLNFGIGVMATLGSEEAQKVLVEWFNEYPESRHTILNALSTADSKLAAETRNLVLGLVDQKTESDLAYNAAFTLGSDLRKQGTEGDHLVEQKLSGLYEGASPSEQLVYLDAMGNSGSSAFAPTVQRSLASVDETVREKGVFAARFMKPEAAQALIAQGLEDPSARVRLSAVKAISYQEDIAPYRNTLERFASEKNEVGLASQQILSGQETHE